MHTQMAHAKSGSMPSTERAACHAWSSQAHVKCCTHEALWPTPHTPLPAPNHPSSALPLWSPGPALPTLRTLLALDHQTFWPVNPMFDRHNRPQAAQKNMALTSSSRILASRVAAPRVGSGAVEGDTSASLLDSWSRASFRLSLRMLAAATSVLARIPSSADLRPTTALRISATSLAAAGHVMRWARNKHMR